MKFDKPRFEIPRIELPADLAKSLTDAGHTAVGFATLAAKRANDARLETNARFEPQLVDARKRALELVESLESARVRMESTVEPIVDRAVDRLPEQLQDAVGDYRRMGKELAAKAHDGAVKVIEFATAVPVSIPVRRHAASSAAEAPAAPKAARTVKTATRAKATKPGAKGAGTTPKAATPKAATPKARAAKAAVKAPKRAAKAAGRRAAA